LCARCSRSHTRLPSEDVPAKKEIVRQLDMVKLDIVEAKVLTGTDDLSKAARLIEFWGRPEVVIRRPKACWRKRPRADLL
jgi:sugar/nucleoside kinase (ribokinase family)